MCLKQALVPIYLVIVVHINLNRELDSSKRPTTAFDTTKPDVLGNRSAPIRFCPFDLVVAYMQLKIGVICRLNADLA